MGQELPDGPDTTSPNTVTEANFMSQMSRYVALSLERRALEAKLKLVEADLGALDEPLRMQMAEHGVSNMRAGGLTVYINRQLWAGGAKVEVTQPDGTVAVVNDRQITCDALIAAGQGQFVEPSFNVNTVSAWVRELPQDDNGAPILPPELVGKISVAERYQLRTRK